MKKFSKKFNIRKIKKGKSYSAKDLSETLSVSEGTIFNWMRQGLKKIDLKSNKLLFHYLDVINFLKEKNSKNKIKCQEGEFFCFSCKKPRKSIDNEVDLFKINNSLIQIKGVCEVCCKILNQNSNILKLDKLKQIFKINQKHLDKLIGS